MDAHDHAKRIVAMANDLNLNEADTRHQLIDPLIHDVLGWPRPLVRCEHHVNPGYADYLFSRRDGQLALILEAKRADRSFELPLSGDLCSYVKIKTLLTSPDVAAAISQVRDYCLNAGCDVGAVTNGHQYIYFRAFQRNADWRELRAFVVYNISYFDGNFISAMNTLSYLRIAEHGALHLLLSGASLHNRELFYAKTQIHSYEAPVETNKYSLSLRPLADKYFGVIDVNDSTFMDFCYVSEREYDLAFNSARKRIEDAITPFLENYDIRNFTDQDSGGSFANRISKSVISNKPSDVVVLFGGKGVGKSTFLKRLLFHKPPQIIKKSAYIALIDLVDKAIKYDDASSQIWHLLSGTLDSDNLLDGDRAQLESLFADRIDVAIRQDLFGLSIDDPQYNVRLNQIVVDLRRDDKYTAGRLSANWRKRHKGLVVVIDNTDQLPEDVQEACFIVGREISSSLGCLVVISMREERFHSSSIKGVLDAYQNSGFHITPPSPKQVFQKRIAYVQKLLLDDTLFQAQQLSDKLDRPACGTLFGIFKNEFAREKSHLVDFLKACSHGNIRLALELFRGFLVSGYTNVNEMVANASWHMQTHQVIKPFMVPDRFFYDEARSKIPNIFQIRSKTFGSHFTAPRLLVRLSRNQDLTNPPFVPVAQIVTECADGFGMKEDIIANLDIALKHGMIESNNRLERYDQADSVRITAFGTYMLNTLAVTFTYLELVSVDSAIGRSDIANEIATLSSDEYRLYVAHESRERVERRLTKADVFLKYLEGEEKREQDAFHFDDSYNVCSRIRAAFDIERVQVRASADRSAARARRRARG